MTFFSDDVAPALDNMTAAGLAVSDAGQKLQAELLQLHRALQSRLQTQHIDLYISTVTGSITTDSVTRLETGGVLCIPYGRDKGTAITVERLMGREHVVSAHNLETRRHPVIELRLSSTGVTLELVLAPDAWWDQQNLAGKLTVTRHQQEFQSLLQEFPEGYSTGFWEGAYLSEMHLTTKQFQHRVIIDEWMRTFEPGKDWFRMGIWFEWDDERLQADRIEDMLLQQFRVLYPLYQFVQWTGDNNYREFYEGAT
jgi:hypothetical protein